MSIKDAIPYLRLFIPKFHNRLTILLILSGLALVVPPIKEVIFSYVLEKIFGFSLVSENDPVYGIVLIALGLMYNVTMNYIDKSKSVELNPEVNGKINAAANRLISLTSPGISNTILEDRFIAVIGNLPWIKGVGKITVPGDLSDSYLITYKSYRNILKSMIVDIHESNSDSLVFSKMMPNGFCASESDYLISVFWKSSGIWTLVDISDFTVAGNEYSISNDVAMANNLLVVLGDILYQIDNFKLSIEYSKVVTGKGIRHPKYGEVTGAFVVGNKSNTQLELLEMSIIDAFIDMEIIQETETTSGWITVESPKQSVFLNVSSQIEPYIRFTRQSLSPAMGRMSAIFMIELMKKIKAKKLYQIPVNKTDKKRTLFVECFGSSFIDKYF